MLSSSLQEEFVTSLGHGGLFAVQRSTASSAVSFGSSAARKPEPVSSVGYPLCQPAQRAAHRGDRAPALQEKAR